MKGKPVILFVDDERAALEGFKLTQSRHYDVRIANSGKEGLELLRQQPDVAAVVSDMRMPEMDGATFLARVREQAPDAVRLLLTGHADMEAAGRAVNEGRIFRFLTKPCEPQALTLALEAAVEMHALITAERVLLQKTLVGSVKAVVNVLGLTNPMAMGRAVRIRDRSRLAADKLNIENPWGLEFAALFSQLAAATTSNDTTRKLYGGEELTREERDEIVKSMQAINEILADIPRLEPVTRTLGDLIGLTQGRGTLEENAMRTTSDARLLQAIIDLEALESRGQSPRQALSVLEEKQFVYGQDTLAALREVVQTTNVDTGACSPQTLADGMVLAEDLKTTDGLLLLPRGFELSRSSREHIVKRFKDRLPDRIKVHVAPEHEQTTGRGGRS